MAPYDLGKRTRTPARPHAISNGYPSLILHLLHYARMSPPGLQDAPMIPPPPALLGHGQLTRSSEELPRHCAAEKTALHVRRAETRTIAVGFADRAHAGRVLGLSLNPQGAQLCLATNDRTCISPASSQRNNPARRSMSTRRHRRQLERRATLPSAESAAAHAECAGGSCDGGAAASIPKPSLYHR